LFRPSIRLGEDFSVHPPETSPDEGGSVPIPGTPPGGNDPTPISEANLGTLARTIAPSPRPEGEVAVVVGSPSPETDWQKPISEYLRLGTILDDETKNQCLAHKAKGYLCHNDELYRCNTLGVLQWCIPPKEGKVLLLDIHEGICGHHASSRSMNGKAFRHSFYWPTEANNAAQIIRSCRGC
jgi:hypothetical protein